jgi:hypothetical protein
MRKRIEENSKKVRLAWAFFLITSGKMSGKFARFQINNNAYVYIVSNEYA